MEIRRSGDELILGFSSIAVTDNLTLLYTHQYHHEITQTEAQQAAVQCRPFGVVLVELTEIAELNRGGGYLAGDEVIRAAAQAVQHAARRGTARRYSESRLAWIVPGANAQITDFLAAEISINLADVPSVRTAAAARLSGDTGVVSAEVCKS